MAENEVAVIHEAGERETDPGRRLAKGLKGLMEEVMSRGDLPEGVDVSGIKLVGNKSEDEYGDGKYIRRDTLDVQLDETSQQYVVTHDIRTGMNKRTFKVRLTADGQLIDGYSQGTHRETDATTEMASSYAPGIADSLPNFIGGEAEIHLRSIRVPKAPQPESFS